MIEHYKGYVCEIPGEMMSDFRKMNITEEDIVEHFHNFVDEETE